MRKKNKHPDPATQLYIVHTAPVWAVPAVPPGLHRELAPALTPLSTHHSSRLPSLAGSGDLLPEEARARTILNHSIIRVFKPIVCIFGFLGALPLRCMPNIGLSLHPLKSTVLYVVLVQIVVSWSAKNVFAAYHSVLRRNVARKRGLEDGDLGGHWADIKTVLRRHSDGAADVDNQLLGVLAVVHVSSHIIMFVWWAELPCHRHTVKQWGDFSMQHARLVLGDGLRLSRCARLIPWLLVFFGLVVAPLTVAIWCLFIIHEADRWTHYPAHLYQTVFIVTSSATFAVGCFTLRDLAANMAAHLTQELSSGRMTAARLEEYRRAWLNIRKLCSLISSPPLSSLGVMAYTLLFITLTTYQTVVSFYKGYSILFYTTCGLLVLFVGLLVTACDAAHRLTSTMTSGFYEPLELHSWRKLPDDLRFEYQQFLSTISDNPCQVTIGAMVVVNRSTFLSVMAAITTYLIVLFQMRQSDDGNGAKSAEST